jgi:hypothetical protein
MTIVPGASAPSTLLPLAGAGQKATNRREQVLVHHLLANTIEALTDRTGTTHAFPWTPDQQVRIGVLGATINTPPPAAGAGSGTSGDDGDGDTDAGAAGAGQPAVAPPVENRGVVGLDFVIASGVVEVELDVHVAFALYHPLVPDFAYINTEAQVRAAAASAGGGNRRRRPTVPVNPTWVRDNRDVTFTIRAPVQAGEVMVTSDAIPGGDPLEADTRSAVTAHYTNPDALWKLTNNQTLPVAAALGTQADYRQALNGRRDTSWNPLWPQPQLTVTTAPTPNGDIAVSVSITNARVLTERALQDLAVYDTRMSVTVAGAGVVVPQRLGFAKDDVRYADVATVVGRGRGCVAMPGDTPKTIVAETLPLHAQHVAESSDHGIDLRFATLEAGYQSALAAIGSAMRSFLRTWDFSAAPNPGHEHDQLEELRKQFEAEVERYELGCDLLRSDVRLDRAFIFANRAFAAAKGPTGAWRLFQLVFIVSELGALAARESRTDTRLRNEIDSVDVLWFPTGGGKTEAYLGLIAVALFFDRLRDKERGTTAWLLFPLRMLSVQQLARINEILHHAEAVRAAGSLPGDPFVLGYFVGSGNTPNRLGYNDPNSWWDGIDEFAKRSQAERDERRLVGACPSCGQGDSVGLDLADQRLLHVCRTCGHVLAIHSSDEEVTRYQPAVIVSTVDKITAFARNGQLTAINHGPRRRCPQHGWYTHKACIAKGCAVDPSTHTSPSGFYDPTPALWIQDELHLVREELGVFAGHYHTLVAELAAGVGNEPSKVIAATATIEQYEDQLSQVYGRKPRMFPVGGPTLRKSFYTEVVDDIRRIYLGVLPAGGGTVKVDLAASITAQLVEDVHCLTDDPTPLIAALAAEGFTASPTEARAMLFDYELALAFVNSKAHGVVVHDDIHRLSEKLINQGSDPVRSEYLIGDTSLGELAAAVAAIQADTSATARAQRIRALVGTSVISHGVDLDRLNFEVLAGMPPTYADYIQVTARAGRTHVGLVVSVFDRANRRETSMYQSFATTHAALERMVAPVPVNRFATRAVERTLPGIVSALLWDETRNPNWPSIDEISTTRKFRPWWNANAAALIPHLRARIERAYRCPVQDPAMVVDEQKLVDDALDRWENVERQRMQQWQAEWLTDLFTTPAMTSLRDVNPPVEFSGGSRAGQIIARLHG